MSKHLISNVKDLKSAVGELCAHSRLSHDTEADGPNKVGGLHPFHGSRSFAHIFATKDDEFYFNFNTGGINPVHKNKLQQIFDDPSRIIFYVNAMFDATISHFDNLKFNQRIIDCPSIARIEFNGHDGGRYAKDESFLSLEYLADYYGVQSKNDLVKQHIKEQELYHVDRCRFTGKLLPRYGLVPLDLMFEYGCDDARSTYDLGNKILSCINYKDEQHLQHTKMLDVARNEVRLTSVLLEMKLAGAKCWVDYVNRAIPYEQAIVDKLGKEIDALTGGINLNSGPQIAKYLKERGINVPHGTLTANAYKMIDKWEEKRLIAISAGKEKHVKLADEKIAVYKKGNPKTDKKTLAKLMKKHPELDFLSKISEVKESDKKLTTYYKNFLKLKDADDIIHSELNQEKAITGRFSSSNPNFQNLHKEKWDGTDEQLLIRKSIVPKAYDYRLFFFDYKGQEMYIMVDLAEDMAVIKDILENGTDIYIAMANMVKKYTGITIDRAQAKALSLGVAYGQGKTLIAGNLKCTLEEAATLKQAFLGALKGVARLNKRMMRAAERDGKITNPYGRVSYILDKKLAYKALNSLIQGTAADCTKHAMVKVHEFLVPYKSHMILSVHDEIVFEMHKDEYEIIPEIAQIMSDAYPHKHLPLKVDIEYSDRSWGEKKKWKS